MKKSTLPKDIKQLVDKKNYVIAIKTLSERDSISLEAAKKRIDDYEATKHAQHAKKHKTKKTKQEEKKDKRSHSSDLSNPNDLSSLVNSVDDAIAAKGISTHIPAHWLRLGQFLVLLLLLGCLFYIVF